MDLHIHLPIATPPWTGIGKRMESMIRKALYDFDLVTGAEKIAIALSGGKDSLSLLFFLAAISGRGFPPFEIVAIHVAGEYTCGAGVNEGFLGAICDKMGIPLIVRTTDQTLDTLECYSCSRQRRNLIFEAAKQAGATTVAFGHHRDDHAQTLLMNLLHKAEFAGMLPKLLMVDYGVTIIRPLIYISEQDIRQFAKQQGFQRITCQCPVGQNSLRKKTDLLLDQITQLYPNARENIAQAGFLYGSDKAKYP